MSDWKSNLKSIVDTLSESSGLDPDDAMEHAARYAIGYSYRCGFCRGALLASTVWFAAWVILALTG